MTSRRRVQLHPAFVLVARPYRETSRLVEILTPDYGRVGLVARGVRGPRSRLAALLQPWQPLLLSWTEGGDLGTLTAAEAQGAPLALPGERVFSGWYLNELLLRLLQRHDAHPDIFADYADALWRLANDAASDPALRFFEKRLLAAIGYGLLLPDHLVAVQAYRYDWDRGPVAVAASDPDAIAGASLIALRDEAAADLAVLRPLRDLLRAALARQLGEGALRTPALLRELRTLGAAHA